MPTSLKKLLAEAAASVPKISPQDAAVLIAAGDVLVVDVRDGTEVHSTGKVQGAKHVPRGML
jgi:rhodanese-related sulfurtransferase